jgi:hypothetical protein
MYHCYCFNNDNKYINVMCYVCVQVQAALEAAAAGCVQPSGSSNQRAAAGTQQRSSSQTQTLPFKPKPQQQTRCCG